MWPSLETATWLFDAANTILVVSLVFGVASTAIVVWMGGVKEAYLKSELANTNERAAKAEQQTAEARLQLEQLRKQALPRHITQAQQGAIAGKLSGFNNQMVALGVNPSTNENEWLVRWLGAAFSMAGWKVEMNTGDAARNRFVPDGILVQSTRHPHSITVAEKVAEALNAEGLFTSAAPILDLDLPPPGDMSDPRSFRLLVIVGDKPVIPQIERVK